MVREMAHTVPHSEESKLAISNSQKARHAAMRERLDLADEIIRTAREGRPVSDIVRLMPAPLDDDEEDSDGEG